MEQKKIWINELSLSYICLYKKNIYLKNLEILNIYASLLIKKIFNLLCGLGLASFLLHPSTY